MRDPRNVILKPVVTERSTLLQDEARTYTFIVAKDANKLEVRDGFLTGRVTGAVVDADAKAEHLRKARTHLGLQREQVIAAGDGANDIPMLTAAGFGVAYRAKPVLREVADCCLDNSGLDGILALFQ